MTPCSVPGCSVLCAESSRLRGQRGRIDGFPYAVAPDGNRFLVANQIDQGNATLTVVLNWTAALTNR